MSELCPECDGDGYDVDPAGTISDCDTCQGTGEIPNYDWLTHIEADWTPTDG